MTTDKQVADSLSDQGKGMPENDVPPQTIIMHVVPTETQFAIDLISGGAEGIIPLLDDQIDDIAGTFYGDCISIVDRQFARKIEAAHGIGGPTIIRDVERQQLVNAEQRRQTVQAEAMVNLAVGIVLTRQGQTSIGISPQDLADFQRDYTVTQAIGEDGGFIISISPKEV